MQVSQNGAANDFRNLVAFSESIQRENSLMIDSYIDDKPNTNQSNSNILVVGGSKHYKGKRVYQKSKFFNNHLEDNSSDQEDYDSLTNNQNPSLPQFLPPKDNSSFVSVHSSNNQINTKSKERKGYIIIEIIDNGIGMNLEGMQKLFKPFS